MSDQLVASEKNYENEILRYSMTIKQWFCVEESLN